MRTHTYFQSLLRSCQRGRLMCDLLARCLLPVISLVSSISFSLSLSYSLPDPLDPFDNATRTIIPINNLPFGYVKNSFGCASLCRCSLLLLLLLLSTLWNLRQPPGATLPTAAATAAAALTITTTATTTFATSTANCRRAGGNVSIPSCLTSALSSPLSLHHSLSLTQSKCLSTIVDSGLRVCECVCVCGLQLTEIEPAIWHVLATRICSTYTQNKIPHHTHTHSLHTHIDSHTPMQMAA